MINTYYLQDKWMNVLNLISKDENMPEESFIYFNDSKLNSLENGRAIISVPGFINYSILSHYKTLIEMYLEEEFNERITIQICEEKNLVKPVISEPVDLKWFQDVDSVYTFENFVPGRSNLQAHVAAKTCAENPGYVYNPLFIYGSSGIGKTHLLKAMGNEIKNLYPNKKIGYITANDFVDDVFKAKKENSYDEFKMAFRSLDVLLIDDIQFLANKTKSHELFFTIFNDLVNNKKQICVTSDQSPDEIKGLEERLITRFNQGLTVNIVAPEYETAVNIVKLKLRTNPSVSQQVDEDVISYIATNFSQNVRSLEGAITRLLFYSVSFSDNKERIDLKTAIEAFKDVISENKDELSIVKVRKVVCDYYNLTKQQICSSTRTKNIANPRHIAIYLCRKLLDAPYESIGEEFGNRDHSTIMNSCKKVEELIKKDPNYLKAIQDIESRIK